MDQFVYTIEKVRELTQVQTRNLRKQAKLVKVFTNGLDDLLKYTERLGKNKPRFYEVVVDGNVGIKFKSKEVDWYIPYVLNGKEDDGLGFIAKLLEDLDFGLQPSMIDMFSDCQRGMRVTYMK